MKTFILDIKKYKKYSGNKSSFVLFLTTQGLWALFVYRISNKIYTSNLPFYLKRILLIGAVFFQKNIEILTGITLPYSAKIGEKFYIAHHGHIILHPKAIIGNNCNISQGVTIGVSGRGDKKGIPIIGNNVYIGPNAVIAGKITIGDNSVVGANSLVISNVEDNTTVVGVPAIKLSNNNSEDYI